jgi:hypothetical protein
MDGYIFGKLLGPRVKAVEPANDYTLRLLFTNGESRVFNAKPLLDMNVYKPLADLSLFKTVKVAYGSILWSDDIDYCPDTLYSESLPV